MGLQHVRELGAGGQEDHRDVLGVTELQLTTDLVAVHAGHGDVQEDQMGVPGEGDLQALLAGERREDLVSCGGQDGGDSGDEVAVVVYHQYPKPFLRHCLPRKRERAGPRHCSPAPAQVLSAGVVSGISQACLSQSRGR